VRHPALALALVLVAAPIAIPAASPALAAQQPAPQTATAVVGRVVTADGQPVAAADVALLRDGRVVARTAADASGRFRLLAPAPGDYRIRVEALGHAGWEEAVRLQEGRATQVTVTLDIRAVTVDAITVRARRDRARFEEQAGATVVELTAEDLRRLPGLAENDVLRAVEVMPGVISTSDFSAAFNVRGGAADQNLILLDGVPLYNPFHLGGVFSVFNPDMVDRAELMAGGFPARYGGRVSSVLDVRSDPGDGSPGLDAGVSLLAARAAASGGLPTDLAGRLGFQRVDGRIGVRRSYVDVVLAPVFDFPYHLTDVQGVARGITRNGVLTVTGYVGEDVLDLRRTADFPLPVRLGWGNDALGARWTGRAGRNQLELRASTSAFQSSVDFPDFEDTRAYTRIREWRGVADIRRAVRRADLGAGLEVAHVGYDNRLESGGALFRGGDDRGWLTAGWVEATFQSSRWIAEAGLRLDGWNADSAPLALHPSPRLAVKRFLRDGDAAVKLAVGRYTQTQHSLRDEEVPIGIDLWITAGARAPVLVSDQIQAGLEWFGDGWSGAFESYYRLFDGVVMVNPASDPGDPLDAFLEGTGAAYGADLLIRRDTRPGRRVDGWVTLSWLRATRTFADPLRPDAPDLTYAPLFDRRVDLDLVLRYALPAGIDGGLRFNLGTGLPYTRPIASHPAYLYRLVDGRLVAQAGGDDQAQRAVILGPRNAERYPAYHRLDLGVRREFVGRGWTATPYLDVLNIYDRRNVLFYFYDYAADPPVRAGISMLPVVPTLGVEVRF
jgi:hypothetical protein